ncbi:MAG TPA: M20/M25/M40 family metallo-hydrolase [Acidobacteriota bacterium]|nr:M20/M25/M40 family metallo-hydrolase [Acidobacteriota bacterium]
MPKRYLSVFFASLLFLRLAAAQDLPEHRLSRESIEQDLRFLASDELMGRFVTAEGGRLAADYIETRLKEAGARALPSLQGYRQKVPLSEIPQAPSEGSLRLLETEFRAPESLLQLLSPALQGSFPTAVAERLDDLPEKLEGKLVVLPFGDPDRPDSAFAGVRAGADKAEEVGSRGAVALVEVFIGPGFDGFAAFLGRSRVLPREEETTPPIVHLMASATEELWTRLREAQDLEAVLDIPSRLSQSVWADNVVAWVEGSDPELRDQYVALGAHYDHVGADRNLPGASEEDFIYNGARDNGMGVTALLAAARALAEKPPRRSVLLIAFTAEEVGLLGSSYLAEHPPVELSKLVFLLNSDTGGYTDTDVVTVVGLERVTARPLIEKACREFGMEAIPNPAPEQRLFNRSDNIPFARKGVPAPTFSPGFRAWTAELVKHYHRPSDEVTEDFDFDYLLRFSQAFAHAIRLIGDEPSQTGWEEGQSFAEAWRELYGNKP